MAWSLSGQRIARLQTTGPIPVTRPVEKPEFVTAARTSPSARPSATGGAKPEAAPDQPKQSAGLSQGSSQPVAPGSHKVNLNTATQAELELLPGIGPAMAKRILDYRAEHGKFTSVEQLDSVRGIGSRTMSRLRPLVTVD
jgi:competence protein ComEA